MKARVKTIGTDRHDCEMEFKVGDEFEVTQVDIDKNTGRILGFTSEDAGIRYAIIRLPSAHLNGGCWEIVEDNHSADYDRAMGIL